MSPTSMAPQAPSTAPRRVAILVLGMHRSGTSAFTRVINRLGADLPSNLMPPVDGNNEAGFWESMDIYRLNDEILDSAGSSWDDWRRFNPDWFASPAPRAFKVRALEILEQDFDRSSLFVLKDPRICRLLPFWLDVLEAFQTETKCVIPIRNPLEVAASLKRRDGFSPALSSILWLRHVLDAEHDSRGLARAFVIYDDLLNDWRGVITTLGDRIGLAWPRYSATSAVEIDEFLEERHRHHALDAEKVASHPALAPWVKETFAALRILESDPVSLEPLPRLDNTRNELDRASNALGAILRLDERSLRETADNLAEKTVELAARETRIGELEQALADQQQNQTAALAGLQHGLEQYRSHASGLERVVVERDAELAARESRIGELEQALADQHTQTAARESRIGELEQALADQHTQTAARGVPHRRARAGPRRPAHPNRRARVPHRRARAGPRRPAHPNRRARVRIGELEQALADQHTQTAARESRIGELERGPRRPAHQAAARESRIGELEQALADQHTQTAARESRIGELEQALADQQQNQTAALAGLQHGLDQYRSHASGLERVVVERDAEIAAQQNSLTELQLQNHDHSERSRGQAAELKRVIQRLDQIQAKATWQLARPLINIESRWPTLARGLIAFPKIAFWTLSFRLPSRLRVRARASALINSGLFDRDWYIQRNPDVLLNGHNPVLQFLNDDWNEGREANPLFDSRWYIEQYPDVVLSRATPLEDYIAIGWRVGRDPNPLFNTDWYLEQDPHLVETGINPLAHYLKQGAFEGRNPSPLFDSDWYINQYPQIIEDHINPLVDYLGPGAFQGRDPNPLFDSDWYLEQNQDVATATLNPLDHYIRYGCHEGRDPHPLFDSDWYLSRNPELLTAGTNPLAHYLAIGAFAGRDPHPLFHSDWYLRENPDVAAAKLNPLVHYIVYGAREGRDPCPLFDSDWYLRENPDVDEARMNPLIHYLAAGAREGRDPNPLFDSDWYLSHNPDVAQAGMNPLIHYQASGGREGRDPSPGFDTSWYRSQCTAVDALEETPLAHYLRFGRSRGLGPRAEPRQSAGVSEPFKRLYQTMLDSAGRSQRSAEYVPDSDDQNAMTDLAVKVIAFYLPQFHPIPENDAWWGKGFTEWTNVTKAVPQFVGHDQPRFPDALGFYDLRVKETQREQIRLAKRYGIQGFCYHHYWFGGQRLLEQPLQQMLEDPSLDFPFCICWANENWTRRWDGYEQDVLIAQNHSPDDDLAFFADIEPALRDPRYITIEGRPLLIIYRPQLFPDIRATVERWREYARDRGMPQPYLVNVLSFPRIVEPESIGFDAAVEFPPHQFPHIDITDNVELLNPNFEGHVYDYRAFVDEAEARISTTSPFELFPGVMAAWDNTPRRNAKGSIFANASPREYTRWLTAACKRSLGFPLPEKRLVFVNAWNEWAEGTYLEPDRRHGYAYLHATREVLLQLEGPAVSRPSMADLTTQHSILLVGHDAHKHGAQLLLLHLARLFKRRFGYRVGIWLLEGGDLVSDYRQFADVFTISNQFSDFESTMLQLKQAGFEAALTNTVVTGEVAGALKLQGFFVISLVHEMPELIQERDLYSPARALAHHADRIVFACDTVRKAFMSIAPCEPSKCLVLPQGVYQSLDVEPDVRRDVRQTLGIPSQAVLVINAGYGDLRKGIDWFVDCATEVSRSDSRFHFLWVGKLAVDQEERFQEARLTQPLCTNLHHLDFTTSIGQYYAAADAFLLTSREDPFPSVVLEALTCGLPVVAFAGTGGHCEILSDAVNGALATNIGDIGALASALRAVVTKDLADPTRREKRALRARSDFDFPSYGWALLRALDPRLLRVSVIVPNYNYARYLQERLGSILRQDYPIYEIIVLDDSSTDDSVETIERIADHHQRDIRLELNSKNSGSVFRQWSKGIRLAQGDLVWIAEADDLAASNFVSGLAEVFAREEDVLFAFSDSAQLDSDGVRIGSSYSTYCSESSDLDYHSDFSVPTSEFLLQGLAIKNSILNVSSVMFRRQPLITALESVAQELPDWTISGDWRLYIELCTSPGRVHYTAKSLNEHRRHDSSVGGSNTLSTHLSEIRRMHQLVNSLDPANAKIQIRQLEYTDSVKARIE